MTQERLVPYGGLAFVLVAALVLATIVVRSPDTHGHLWAELPAEYARTPLDTVGEADLEAIRADLVPFAFPAPPAARPSRAVAGSQQQMPGMVAEGGHQQMPGMAEATREPQRVTLTTSEFAIAPDRVTLQVGVPVELTVVNEGKQVHGLWAPDFGIAEDIRAGKTEVFTFTPEKPGRYRVICSYAQCGTAEEHARMVGFLVVQ